MKKNIFKIVMIAAFVAFAGLSLAIVNNIHRTVETTVLATNSSLPRAWDGFSTSADAVTTLDVVTSDTVAIYTVSIKNTSSSTLYLENLASFMDEAHGDRDGFLPLSSENTEYSYSENNPDAWSALSLSAPKNGLDGFRLANSLAIGPAGSDTDTLFIRYQVSPSLDKDVISNNFAGLLKKTDGSSVVTTGSTSVAINIESADPFVVAADTPSNDPHAIFDQLYAEEHGGATEPSTVAVAEDDADSAFARPLGVFSEQLSIKTVASVATSTETVDGDFIATTNLILVGILAVFAIAFIGYIVVVKF